MKIGNKKVSVVGKSEKEFWKDFQKWIKKNQAKTKTR